KRS
ncbi:pterin binding enzyme family protein, partial [Vibrio parahaemolyticus V-223/04]